MMALCVSQFYFRSQLKTLLRVGTSHQSLRRQCSTSTDIAGESRETTPANSARPAEGVQFPLSRLPTSSILRSLFLTTFFSTPALYRPGFAILQAVAHSKSPLLNPDKNPFLRALLKPLIYDQFCAGTKCAEIQSTVANIKRLGFSGVILCYGKELQVDGDQKLLGNLGQGQTTRDLEIKQWKEGNLQTLALVGEGDWLGVKLTGAGQSITEALLRGHTAPVSLIEAMNAICETAAAQGCRIWIDAEQQAVQSTIDKWTIDLMRLWNKGSKPLIYNTVQAYLKDSQSKLQHQLRLARDEGWTLGVKLVRGAYISNDIRTRIYSTKAETDASYECIVNDLLQGTLPGFSQEKFPKLGLFLAGHNSKTIRRATTLARKLSEKGQLKVAPEFGQLQGMADDIGCELLQCGDGLRDRNRGIENVEEAYYPRVYKCLTWGSVQECMQYLVRRTIENKGAAERLKEGSSGLVKEIKRRLARKIWRSSATHF